MNFAKFLKTGWLVLKLYRINPFLQTHCIKLARIRITENLRWQILGSAKTNVQKFVKMLSGNVHLPGWYNHVIFNTAKKLIFLNEIVSQLRKRSQLHVITSKYVFVIERVACIKFCYKSFDCISYFPKMLSWCLYG